MTDDKDDLADLLNSTLSLTLSDQVYDISLRDHFIEILTNYSNLDRDPSNAVDSYQLCDMRTYVDSELTSRFQLSNTDLNFDTSSSASWLKLLEGHWNSVEHALSLQIIISLANISLLNKMKLARLDDFKLKLFERLSLTESMDALVKTRLTDLYSLVLTINCNPTDLLEMYTHFNLEPMSQTLNSLAAQLSDPLSQNYVQFENYYKIYKVPHNENIQYTLQFFIEFNNVTSNRIMTIGRNIYMEIKEGHICISNDEFIIALFEEFEFEAGVFYSLSLTINEDEISLYVDGNFINHISLFEGSVTSIEQFDLGSMICSFKLFRFVTFTATISEESIKVIYAMGSTFRNTFENKIDMHRIRLNFGDAFLEKISSSTRSSGVSLDALLKKTEQINKDNLLIDFDPSDGISMNISKEQDSLVRFRDEDEEEVIDDLAMGKCFYYKAADLLSFFTSIDCFRIILCNLEKSKDMDELYNQLSHLMTLLQHNHLRNWFQKEFGFPLLSHILTSKVIKKMGKSLPIQFLDLFQEFCGWDFSNITNSMIENEVAYQNLVLNFDLWYLDSLGDDESYAGIEIIRFLFFQISNLLETSKYQHFNSQKLRNLNVLERLCNSQHLFAERHGYPNIFDELKDDLSSVYYSLLKDNLTKGNIQWLLQFSYFELKSGFYQNSEVAMNAVDLLCTESLNNNDTTAIRIFTDSISPKFLLMVLEEVVLNKRNPIVTLNILLKLLLLHQLAYKNFVKSNGLDLILSILKNANASYYENIIHMLYRYSLGEYDVDPKLKVPEDLQTEPIHSESTLVMKELLYLALNLLEWAVINDIRNSFPLDLENFIIIFFKKLSILLSNSRTLAAVDPVISPFFLILSDFLITLTKPQNTSIYETSAKMITETISKNVIQATMTLNTSDFERYLDALTNPSYSETNSLSADSVKHHSYIQLSFLRVILPVIFKDISDLGSILTTRLRENAYMLSNILVLFNHFKQQFAVIRLKGNFYVNTFECLLSCVEIVDENGNRNFKNVTKSSLWDALSFIIVTLLYPILYEKTQEDYSSLQVFYKTIQDHSATLFAYNHGACDADLISFLLQFLLMQLKVKQHTDNIVRCIKCIVVQRWKDIRIISESLNVDGAADLYSIFIQLSSFEDESDISTLLKSENILIAAPSEHFIKYALKRIRLKESSKMIKESQLEYDILESKQSIMESKYTNMEKRHALFRSDNVPLDKRLRTVQRKHYTNFVTDMEEDVVVHKNQYSSMAFQFKLTLSIQQNTAYDCTWGLDSVEDFNRMKGRLIPFWEPENVCEVTETKHDLDTTNERPKVRQKKTTNSLLSYDLLSDLESLDFMVNDKKDENRKVLKVLKGSDSIKTIWNASLVIGLDAREGILIVGRLNLYFVTNYYFAKDDNKVLRLSEVPDCDRDTNISLITGSASKHEQLINNHEVHTWQVSDLIFVTKRPFLFRDAAMELLFENGTNCFLCFNNKSYRDEVYHIFDKLPKNKNIDPLLYNILQEMNTRSSIIGSKNGISKTSLKTKFVKAFSTGSGLIDGFAATNQWQKGEISNFYYLIILNTLAGRTYNDLTQYPVFPWVIADYSSEELDLNNPSTFRDLSKPMGAQSKKREWQFIERYEALEALKDPNSPPFHYGTHYSSAMIVSSYLIRLRPFVDSFLLLQDGRFGHADRLFSSIDRTWSSAAVENTTDVRELTPEFFFLPEFLLNVNTYDFGKNQNGNKVDNVILPPWAKGDPKAFIWKNREALESPYVSKHLHLWIDLIFGYKQRGENAVSAVNVFNNLSYPGAVDLDSISDENERRAITGIIHNFGQTPLQIFQEAHPQRYFNDTRQIPRNIWHEMECLPSRTYRPLSETNANWPIRYIFWEQHPEGSVCWKGYPFLDLMITSGTQFLPLKLILPFSLQIGSDYFEFIHFCRITAFSLWKQQEFVTGDESGLIKVWKYCESKTSGKLFHLGTLYGHLAEIADLRLYSDYNVLLSVDTSGAVYLWDMINYQIIRRLSLSGRQIAMSQNYGSIAISSAENKLSIFNFSGLLYASISIGPNKVVTCLEFLNFSSRDLAFKRHAYWKEKEVIVVGYSNGTLDIFELILVSGAKWQLELLKSLDTGKPFQITCIKTQLRIYPFDTGEQNLLDVPKLEIMAGNSMGFLYLWK